MPGFVFVAKRSEIPEGSGLCVEVEGKRIALFRLGDDVCAIDDSCSHAEGPLSEGGLEGDVVECPWHGSRFNVRTGGVLEPPATEGVATYVVRVTGEEVEVEL
jgi:3-phenylpropionate/trans-cinnamate dioxygenase ferredoxin component